MISFLIYYSEKTNLYMPICKVVVIHKEGGYAALTDALKPGKVHKIL